MRDLEPIAALIDRIVSSARIAGRSDREDLRAELWTHFEEVGTAPESIADALGRFGDEAQVTASLRSVYRADYVALYAAKIAVCVLASFAAALLIVAVVNLRVAYETEVWRLAPGFSRAAGMSLAVVVGVVAVWEAIKPPFSTARAAMAVAAFAAVCVVMQLLAHAASVFVTATFFVALGFLCSRIASRKLQWLLTFATFAAGEYGLHLALSVALPLPRAAGAGASLAAVWGSTLLILRHADRRFGRLFDASGR